MEQMQQIYIQIQQPQAHKAHQRGVEGAKEEEAVAITSSSTIINIPTTTTAAEVAINSKPTVSPLCLDVASGATQTTYDTDCSNSSHNSSSSRSSISSSSSSNKSTASRNCCTRHSEEIYMERAGGGVGVGVGVGADTDADDDIDAVHYKADHTKSWPIFILSISLIEIAIFVYDFIQMQPKTAAIPVAIPTDSVLIYRPDRRLEIWRFVSYMFLHANLFHLGFNVVVQLFYGIPLEVMHGSARIAIIYFAGVFAGSLGTSVVDSEVYLVGASGGVYALLAAHLANITLNYAQMKYAVAQLLSVLIFVTCDLGYACYTQFLFAVDNDNDDLMHVVGGGGSGSMGIGVGAGAAGDAHTNHRFHHQHAAHQHLHNHINSNNNNNFNSNANNIHTPNKHDLLDIRSAPPVSYIAHFTGALAGLTIGLLVLKNFERRAYKNLIWWLALGIYSAFTVFAIVFNLINTMTAQLMEEQGEVITQHLLHDLGVS